jgi:hypothetical protein
MSIITSVGRLRKVAAAVIAGGMEWDGKERG